jgi:2-methylcitrate dehydratase PrpD
MTVSQTLADFAADISFADLPTEVVRETKRLILDTIGCGLGGYAVEKGQMAVAYAKHMGGTAEATILGQREKVPASIAAFANGDLMNALDWNVLMPPSHVPPYSIPPALALVEKTGASGADLITGAILAMEVSGRVGTALGGLRATKGGYPKPVWGISSNQIGATAGAARILGLDGDKMLHALGLAAFHAPLPSHVKYNHTKEIGYAKFAPSGWMAQAGVTTAELAQMGYRGDTTFLETDHGFWAMNSADHFDADKITSDLGQTWVAMNTAYKFWPTCGFYQSPLDLFTTMIDEFALQPEEIDEVTYHIEQFASIPKYLATDPNDHIEAAASGPYVIAVAAHRIPRGPAWQAKELLRHDGIRAFMKKVRHATNPKSEEFRRLDIEERGLPYLSHRPARITIKARGQIFDKSVDYAQWLSMGVPDYIPTDVGLAEKFRINAEGVLSPGQTEEAIERIMTLENEPSVKDLMRALSA